MALAIDKVKYLIVGGGLASASAVEELVKADPGAKGATLLVTSEAVPPYHRPPLSKGYYLGSETWEDARVHPDEFYSENGIEVLRQSSARLIDPASRTCELDLNRSVKFERALIATGASPNRWLGGGRGLEGIFYLRTIADSDRLKEASERWNRVVVVGSSFISMELASAFAQKGIKTTVLSRELLPWQKLGNPEASRFFKGYFEKRGVSFVLEDEPAGFVGASQVNQVHTKKGQKLPCDAVVLGIGVKPNVELAEASRLRVDDGIIVSQTLETSQSGIFAAGDVANFEDSVFGVRGRVEHWDNAQAQGQTAGRNLAGAEEKFEHLRMFFSDIFDLSFELWGMNQGADRLVQRGEVSSKNISSWYLDHGVIIGAMLMGRPPEESEAAAKLIESRAKVTGRETILANQKTNLLDLI